MSYPMQQKVVRMAALLAQGGATLLVSCGDATESCDTEGPTVSQAIRLENSGSGLVDGVGPSPPVLVQVRSAENPENVEASCTGTYVQLGLVLTAKHCLRNQAIGQIVAKTGPTAHGNRCILNSVPAINVDYHPTLDLALVYVRPLAATVPIALFSGEPTLDARLWLSGYGATETWSTGELRTIEASLKRVDSERLVVQGRGGGACVGDSGGPIFIAMPDGTIAQLGVLQRGSATCLGADEYVRLSAARSWLEERGAQLMWVQ